MKLLIIEDSDEKTAAISRIAFELDPQALVDRAPTLTETVKLLEANQYDLIIFDFMMPTMDGSAAQNLGLEILRVVRSSRINRVSDCVAITAYEEISHELRATFTDLGVFILDYSAEETGWHSTLKVFLNRACAHQRRRFVIICAVPIEREAYYTTNKHVGTPLVQGGLDLLPLQISGVHGFAVLLPRMGIVNAAAITSLVSERYRPSIICMSGICAGIAEKTSLGQVIVANPCWEHQVGKETPSGFKVEPYQIALDENFRLKVNNVINQNMNLEEIYADIPKEKLTPKKPIIAPLVSGSMVVANRWKMRSIRKQHRKLAGLEMEAFGVIQAAKLANPSTVVFSAKAVVDFADKKKNKSCQREASIVSARFCELMISQILEDEEN